MKLEPPFTESTHLLIDNDVNLHPGLRASLEDLIQSPFRVARRGPTHKQLGGQPPVGDIDRLLCAVEGLGHRPEIIAPIDVPLDSVAGALGSIRLESVGFGNGRSFLVRQLLMRFVVPVIGVEVIAYFAEFVLDMLDFLCSAADEMGVLRLRCQCGRCTAGFVFW